MSILKKGSQSFFLEHLCQFFKEPLGILSFIIVLFLACSALFANIFAPYDPNAINVIERLSAPSSSHLLGTDQLGRDVFSRVLMGGRIALQVALISVGIAMFFGLVLGLIAGYGPSWLDSCLIVFFDSIRSFPNIMFALAVVTLIGPSLQTVILVVVVTSIPSYGRVVRTQTQAIKNQPFILAEKAIGTGSTRILAFHILPNIIGPLLILACMEIPLVITIESGLSFLGLGVNPPTPSWGSILNDGYNFIENTPWLIIAGSIPLILTTLGFTYLGETLRDILDPKLRKEQ